MIWRGKIAVANKGEDSISFINPHLGREEFRIYLEAGTGPGALVRFNNSPTLLVVNAFDSSLACLDLDSGVVEEILPVGRCPSSIAVCNRMHAVYVTNADSDSISVIQNGDEFNVVSQIPVGSAPQGIDCHPHLPLLAIAHINSQDIWLVETEGYTLVKKMVIEGYPVQVKFSSKGDILYAGCYFHSHKLFNRVLLIDPHEGVICHEIDVGCIPHKILESRDGSCLLVTSCEAGRLEVVDLASRSVVHAADIGETVCDIALDQEGIYAYVTAAKEGCVCVVDWKAGKKIGNIRVGKNPSGIVYLGK